MANEAAEDIERKKALIRFHTALKKEKLVSITKLQQNYRLKKEWLDEFIESESVEVKRLRKGLRGRKATFVYLRK